MLLVHAIKDHWPDIRETQVHMFVKSIKYRNRITTFSSFNKTMIGTSSKNFPQKNVGA
jgi:hypothetical protein